MCDRTLWDLRQTVAGTMNRNRLNLSHIVLKQVLS